MDSFPQFFIIKCEGHTLSYGICLRKKAKILEKPWKDRSVGRYNTNEVKTSLTCSTIRETMLFIKQLYYNTLKTRTQQRLQFQRLQSEQKSRSRCLLAASNWKPLPWISHSSYATLFSPYGHIMKGKIGQKPKRFLYQDVNIHFNVVKLDILI